MYGGSKVQYNHEENQMCASRSEKNKKECSPVDVSPKLVNLDALLESDSSLQTESLEGNWIHSDGDVSETEASKLKWTDLFQWFSEDPLIIYF